MFINTKPQPKQETRMITNHPKPKTRYTTLLHEQFHCVQMETYHPDGDRCYMTTYGSDEKTMLDDVSREDLVHHALRQPHSFIFVRSDGVRLIRAFDEHLELIDDIEQFLDLLGISLHLDTDRSQRTDVGKFYSKAMNKVSRCFTDEWNTAQIKAWQNILDTSIGAGANKEMVEVSTHGHLLPQFDIPLEKLIDSVSKGDNNVQKIGKYLGRLLRPFRYFTTTIPRVKTVDMEIDAYIDGFTGLVDHHWLLQSTGLALEPGDRVEWTQLNERGLLKGHGLIADLESDGKDIVLFGNQYKTQITGRGITWSGFEHLKGSNHVYLDIQTMVNMFDTFKDAVPSWAEHTIGMAFQDAVAGRAPQHMEDLDGAFREHHHPWAIRRMANHQLEVSLPVLMRRVWKYWASHLVKYDVLRVQIPGAIRRYVTPDLHDMVKPGHIIIDKGSFMINRDDARNWLHVLHGGSDHDDSFVLIPIRHLGRDRVLLYRNPNQFGEWSVLDIQSSDHTFTAVNMLPLPRSQRANWPSDQTTQEIMSTINAFWEHLADSNVAVEKCLLRRLPKRIRDDISVIDGELTGLVTRINTVFEEANRDFQAFIEDFPIAAEFKTTKNCLYPIARDINKVYGATMARIMATEELDDDHELRHREQIDRLHAKIRGILACYTNSEQMMITECLMFIRYTERPGKMTGDFLLTQANDGVLGIPSSPTGANRGTVDILIDYLVDRGYGVALEQHVDPLVHSAINTLFGLADKVVQTVQTSNNAVSRIKYSPGNFPLECRGRAVRIYGVWRQLAETLDLDPRHLNEGETEQLIEMAHEFISALESIRVCKGHVYDGERRLGTLAERTRMPDGNYKILATSDVGKSITLYLA